MIANKMPGKIAGILTIILITFYGNYIAQTTTVLSQNRFNRIKKITSLSLTSYHNQPLELTYDLQQYDELIGHNNSETTVSNSQSFRIHKISGMTSDNQYSEFKSTQRNIPNPQKRPESYLTYRGNSNYLIDTGTSKSIGQLRKNVSIDLFNILMEFPAMAFQKSQSLPEITSENEKLISLRFSFTDSPSPNGIAVLTLDKDNAYLLREYQNSDQQSAMIENFHSVSGITIPTIITCKNFLKVPTKNKNQIIKITNIKLNLLSQDTLDKKLQSIYEEYGGK